MIKKIMKIRHKLKIKKETMKTNKNILFQIKEIYIKKKISFTILINHNVI
jgi:hypothetical protein